MSDQPVLYGAPYSVYVRAVRLALAEKGVAYRLVPIDVFDDAGALADQLDRHPFGKIPAFEHRGFKLYEAGAITRYIDEAFDGPSLQPGSPQDRARVNQVLSVLDSYVYRTLVWDIFIERIVRPSQGRAPDEARIAAALPRAATCLLALERIMGDGPLFVGASITLADLHAVPMFDYFIPTPEADRLLDVNSSLRRWWNSVSAWPSVIATTTR